MKNKNLLVAMSKLLKIDKSVFEAELEKEDGDDSIIKGYTDKHQAYTVEEIGKLIENSNKAYLEKADFDINEVPKNLYSKIKAAAFEKFEKDTAKKHGVESYTSLDDLIIKLTAKNNDGKGNQADEELKNQIEVLKQAVLDKETAFEELNNKIINDELSREFSNAVNSLPLDYDEEALPKQIKLLQSAFNSEFKITKKEDKIIVSDANGKPVLDKLADPAKITDVLKTFVSDFGFKLKTEDAGGRGTGGSDGSVNHTLNFKGKTFKEVLTAKGVKENTDESDDVYKEWIAANPK